MNIIESQVPGYTLIKRGKVRDIYDAGENLLIVATDRLSAFDVILPDPIPGKGEILTRLSNFWFARTRPLIENHLVSTEPWSGDALTEGLRPYAGRSVLVHKAEPLAIEAVVRGYLAGSGWEEYQKNQAVCGVKLPSGLRLADQLPEPIFTPATKAPQGSHDENIDFERAASIVGADIALQVRQASLAIYSQCSLFARQRGIIIADTKFEFGIYKGKLILIDEVLTPDSSRFWPADSWRPGKNPPSFDKQFVRDHLTASGWDKNPPAPRLPEQVIQRTAGLYQQALKILTA